MADRLNVSYVRESARGSAADDRYGPLVQRDEITNLAANDGRSIDKEYFEIHRASENDDFFDRPIFSQLRHDIAAGQICVVYFHAFDRLHRDPIWQQAFFRECLRYGTLVRAVHDDVPETPDEELVSYVRGLAARREAEVIKRRTQAGRRKRAESGKPIAGKRPRYGLLWANDQKTHFIEHPDHGPVVRRIFHEAQTAKTLRQIATDLTRDGIPSPTGLPEWRFEVLSKILSDERYTGKGAAWRGEFELPTGTFPQIITPAEFEAAQDRLAKNKAQSSRNAKYPDLALLRGGYAVCGYCGSVLHTKGLGGQKHPRYVCDSGRDNRKLCPSPTITINRLDTEIWRKLTDLLRHPDILMAELEHSRGENPAQRDLESVERSIKEVTKQRDTLASRLVLVDDAVAPIIAQRLNALQADVTRLEVERDNLRTKAERWKTTQHDVQDALRWCEAMSLTLDDLGIPTRRLLLSALDLKVKVFANGHAPRYTVSAAVPLDAPADTVVLPSTDR